MVQLVTGASGFIGRYLVEALMARGEPVRLFDLRTPTWLSEAHLRVGKVEYVRGDVTYRPDLQRALQGVDTIYHLGALLLMAGDEARMKQVNVEGTRTLLTLAREAGVRKVVYTSTGMLYDQSRGRPTREDDPPRPSGPYGRSKREAEAACRAAIEQGMELAVLRPLFVMGPGRLGVMHLLFQRVRRGRPIYMVGDGSNRFHMIHAADVAQACILASRPGISGFFNIGAAEPHTVRELMQALKEHAGTDSELRPLPRKLVRLGIETLELLKLAPIAPEQQAVAWQERVLDCSRAHEELGFRPRFTDIQAWQETYDWYLSLSGRTDHAADWPDGGILKFPLLDRLL